MASTSAVCNKAARRPDIMPYFYDRLSKDDGEKDLYIGAWHCTLAQMLCGRMLLLFAWLG
jgi:hypothetical protein